MPTRLPIRSPVIRQPADPVSDRTACRAKRRNRNGIRAGRRPVDRTITRDPAEFDRRYRHETGPGRFAVPSNWLERGDSFPRKEQRLPVTASPGRGPTRTVFRPVKFVSGCVRRVRRPRPFHRPTSDRVRVPEVEELHVPEPVHAPSDAVVRTMPTRQTCLIRPSGRVLRGKRSGNGIQVREFGR